MKIKKVLSLVLAVLVICVAFTACTPTQAPAASSPTAAAPSAATSSETQTTVAEGQFPYKIGFSQCVMNHPFRITMVDTFKLHAKEYPGLEIIVTDAEGQVEKEIANIESLISQGCDAIIVSSLSGASIYPAYEQVAKAGIPLIIAASGQPDDDSIPYTSFVSTDEVSMGKIAADYIAKLMGEEGNLVYIRGVTESTNSANRFKGFQPTIEKYTNIKIVATQPAEWLRLTAMKVMTDILQSNPQIDGIFCENDEMALGCIEAIKDAGRDGEMVIVSMDGQKEAVDEMIKPDSMLKMTVFNQPDTGTALATAIKAIRGEKVEKVIYMETPVIDGSNVMDFVGKTW